MSGCYTYNDFLLNNIDFWRISAAKETEVQKHLFSATIYHPQTRGTEFILSLFPFSLLFPTFSDLFPHRKTFPLPPRKPGFPVPRTQTESYTI